MVGRKNAESGDESPWVGIAVPTALSCKGEISTPQSEARHLGSPFDPCDQGTGLAPNRAASDVDRSSSAGIGWRNGDVARWMHTNRVLGAMLRGDPDNTMKKEHSTHTQWLTVRLRPVSELARCGEGGATLSAESPSSHSGLPTSYEGLTMSDGQP